MRRAEARRLFGLAVLAGTWLAGCGHDGKPDPAAESDGRIIATARHVPDRQGDLFQIAAYGAGIDWAPGTDNSLIVSSTVQAIDATDYSVTRTMPEMGSQGLETDQAKSFSPGEYSILFYVMEPGSSPDHFAEVRIHVNGDASVEASSWDRWVAIPPSP